MSGWCSSVRRMGPRTMPDGKAGGLRSRFAAIDARLDAAATPAEREALKGDIVSLFKQVEAQIAELSALKDDVKRLVEKWKSAQAAAAPVSATSTSPGAAPQFAPERPKPMADHLGASTFIEKGWSLISLGEYDGAEKALTRALQLAPEDPQSESLLGWAQMLQEKYDDALMNFQKVLMREPANALARINVGYICLKKRIFGEAIEHLSRSEERRVGKEG